MFSYHPLSSAPAILYLCSWICADPLPSAASRQSCFDKPDRARWQKCDSLIPSLHSSQQDVVSSGAVFFDLQRDFKLRNQPNTDLQSLCPWRILAINAVRCRVFLYVTWEREYGVCHLTESVKCWVYIRVQSVLMDCHSLAAQ